ncbi:helix-turn-helix domain-containing protein [Paenibacillus lactis]|uniref:helix-turn-helix domain-containing protein n=1 Tax=Paenibacillus lactis TaxID=228574 RepID=UPI0020413194|nr:helix-turn-helix domain-containing protein [Paenibacillus lactis]MCM3497663.1 helix-turn-helix domain-containing protein [Paenibacillus lactis]
MGLGKRRSPFGAFLDRHRIKQENIAKLTGLSRDTVSDICSDPDYRPRRSTVTLLLMAAKQLTGKNVDKRDFWA